MNYGTGLSGFIGSYLSKKLDINAIPHELIQHTKLKPFDNFFFLSSYGNLASHNDEEQIFKANVEDLLYILRQIRNVKFDSFVYLSSSSVMLKTQTTYSRCKKASEGLLLAFMERHDLPVCIIRPFSVTGVGEQEEHLIPTLIRAAFSGEMVNFVPNATHDFIDVEDVVSGIVSLSNHSARGIFQLGFGKKYANKDVLEIVEETTGRKIKVNIVKSLRDYDNEDWWSTNYKARSYGWLPKKTLEQSIKEMVVSYEQQINRGV